MLSWYPAAISTLQVAEAAERLLAVVGLGRCTDPITCWLQVTSHPFLCDGLEEDIAFKRAASKDSELQMLVGSSGKMLLLAKLLPKLRAEGHKVRVALSGWASCPGGQHSLRQMVPRPWSHMQSILHRLGRTKRRCHALKGGQQAA